MPEQLLTPFVTPDKKRNFPKAVTEAVFRGSKMKSKFKLLTRALSVKKKSYDPSAYSRIVSQDGIYVGNYVRQTSPSALELTSSKLTETSPDIDTDDIHSLRSEAVKNLAQTFEELATDDVERSYKGDNSNCTDISTQHSFIKHDSKATCVVELAKDETHLTGTFSGKPANLEPRGVTYPKPAVRPPMLLKSDLYTDNAQFQGLDRHALMISMRDYTDTTELLQDLTENCTCELEKARVLFRWVIALDQKNARGQESVTSQVIGTGDVHSQKLFHTLCRQAGLHSEIIVGYSKGAGYRPGMRVDHKSHRNCWSAVAIDSTWRFINCTWAARHMTGNSEGSSQLLQRYDEFYFLTDPEEHIYQHFPDDPKWQLLTNPLSLEEFADLPVVKSPFFKHGLQFSSPYSSIITTANGFTDIKLKAPIDVNVESRLHSSDSTKSQIRYRILQRRVGDEVVLTVVPPTSGSYHLSVYAGNSDSDVLECVLCVRVDVPFTDVTSQAVPNPPYPPASTLGPTPLMTTLGVTTNTHHDPLITMVRNALRLDFDVKENTKFTHTLQYFDIQNNLLVDIDRYAFCRSRTDSQLSYSVACPRKGSYIFSLYGASRNSNSYDCLYQYLLICPSDNLGYLSFPKSYHGWRHCSLVSPLHGELAQDKEYTFSLRVKGAANVFVVIGLDKHPLQRGKGDKWTGKVSTGKDSPRVTVIAELISDNGYSYFTRLVTYNIL